MKHPLTRLFATISMIIVIAASSVALAITDTTGFDASDAQVAEMAQNKSGALDSAVAIQPLPELP